MKKWIVAVTTAWCAAVLGAGVPAAVHGSAAATVIANSDWTVYHHDAGGSGMDASGVSFSSPALAWSSPILDGKVYGEPLEATGRVFVATENDTVYALAANTGAVLWSDHLGTPVPSGDLPCGDISPTVGITSTPVLDTTLGEIFVVTDEMVAGQPMHRLWGLNMYNGGTLLQPIPVDPPGQNPLNILNRASLTLDSGHVVFGYGGNDGDCAAYHGWVVSVPESGGSPAYFEVDATAAGQSMGAVWMGGAAPVVDSSGNIWIATGNGSTTSSSQPYDNSDGVLELSASLQLMQYFAPSTWTSDNANDRDLGSSAPALLGNGIVFQAGKSQTGYVLNSAHLGGIGGELQSISICPGANVDGGSAFSGSTVYVPCQGGVTAVQTALNPARAFILWQTSTGAGGPPIIAGGLVWTISSGTLFGLNPSNGNAAVTLSLGYEPSSFPSLSAGDGLLLAPLAYGVRAYTGSLGLPGSPSPPPTLGGITLDAYGGIHSFGDILANTAGAPYWPGFPIARSAVVLPGATGGWTLDGYGAIHAWGTAPAISSSVYWPGWDIARALVVLPDEHSGYVLDGFGGLHPFGPDAPSLSGSPYWPGADVARGLDIHLNSSGIPDGGYVLDAWGGIHPFGAVPAMSAPAYVPGHSVYMQLHDIGGVPYAVSSFGIVTDLSGGGLNPTWNGYQDYGSWNILRDVVLVSNAASATPPQPVSSLARAALYDLEGRDGGVILDGFGGLHPFGNVVLNTAGAPYWPGWDIARSIVVKADGSGGWTLDGYGGIHAWGNAAQVATPVYWPGWDIARSMVCTGTGANGNVSCNRGYLLDGYGGIHAWGGAPSLPPGLPYFGTDVARGLIIELSGSGIPVGAAVLDAYGGIHTAGTVSGISTLPSLTPNIQSYGALHSVNGEVYVIHRYGSLTQMSSGYFSVDWSGYADWGRWNILRDIVLTGAGSPYGMAQPISSGAQCSTC